MADETNAPGGAERSALRAVAHPVRLQILSLLTGAAERGGGGPRELDVSTRANASYHLRVLGRGRRGRGGRRGEDPRGCRRSVTGTPGTGTARRVPSSPTSAARNRGSR